MQRKFLSFLVILLFLLIFCNFSYSDRIEFVYPINNVTILQGKSLTTRVVLENIDNETIEWIQIKIEAPSGIEIKQLTEINFLHPDGKESFRFEIVVSEDVFPGEKEIKLVAESDGISLGEGYAFNITVVKDPSIATTTSSSSTTTTTIKEITTTTVQETENTTTTTIESKKPKFSKISMIIIIVIIIVSLVISILFLKSTKKKEHSSLSDQIY